MVFMENSYSVNLSGEIIMGFPFSEKDRDLVESRLEDIKRQYGFDEFLSYKIAERMIMNGVIDRRIHHDASTKFVPIITREINPRLVHVICSENLLEGHLYQVKIKSKNYTNYKQEDNVRKKLRVIIEDLCNELCNSVDKDDVRKKLTGCMTVMQSAVNKINFLPLV
jgi:hypothetical protein